MINNGFLMPDKPLVSPGAEAAEKTRFGNFEVMNDPDGHPLLLGKGTFGRTYQARHCYLDTIVALKIITERYVADPTVRQRFLTEARAVAKLSHPHIARSSPALNNCARNRWMCARICFRLASPFGS